MSWQLGAFTLLGLALAGGFAWYERVRPDARIVALVATLAAFAALGRIAFAAIPNVKPTTDIVLISGFALGGGPGFAVGALGGLASNFFFGQGPWTPWQMAAWGVTGAIGALLATAVTVRRPGGVPRIGRVPLAVVCGVVGFAFTAVQDLGDWVTYSDHSAVQLGAYVGQGLGFDAIHAVGCIAFALAFGPALIHAIQRFTRRLQVRWVAPGASFPPLAVLVVLAVAGAIAGLGSPPAARAGGAPGSPVGYLLGAQNRDGGFGQAAGQPSNDLFTGWAALGLAAAGVQPRRAGHGGTSAIDYIAAHGAGGLDTGSLERTILLERSAGLSGRDVGGHDLVGLLAGRRRANGSFDDTVNHTAFGILALRSAGVPAPAATVSWLLRQQDGDGGYGFAGAGSSSDSDDTGAVLEALAGVPAGARARARAVGYLRSHQDRDGGFAAQDGAGSNAQSTAWAVQGLLAAGLDPAGLHRHGSPSPLQFLRSLIGPSGAVAYAHGQLETPVWVTGEALMALQQKPLPLSPLPPPAAPRRRSPAGAGRAAHAAAAPAKAHAASRGPHRVQHHRRVSVVSPAAARETRALQERLLRIAAGAGLAAAALFAPVGMG
jgi:energy-coupling factor transport system substrate-specific component